MANVLSSPADLINASLVRVSRAEVSANAG